MSTSMRAKMKLTEVTQSEHSETLTFSAVCKKTAYGSDGLDEDNTFATFTPSASVMMRVSNPALRGKFTPGEVYYVDFTPAE